MTNISIWMSCMNIICIVLVTICMVRRKVSNCKISSKDNTWGTFECSLFTYLIERDKLIWWHPLVRYLIFWNSFWWCYCELWTHLVHPSEHSNSVVVVSFLLKAQSCKLYNKYMIASTQITITGPFEVRQEKKSTKN